MNPLEVFVMALAGIIVITIVSNLLTELNISQETTNDELDLINLLNIYQTGLNLNAFFNATYTPSSNGSLLITSEAISLNNATKTNPGLKNIEKCNYNHLLITEEGVSCLNN